MALTHQEELEWTHSPRALRRMGNNSSCALRRRLHRAIGKLDLTNTRPFLVLLPLCTTVNHCRAAKRQVYKSWVTLDLFLVAILGSVAIGCLGWGKGYVRTSSPRGVREADYTDSYRECNMHVCFGVYPYWINLFLSFLWSQAMFCDTKYFFLYLFSSVSGSSGIY